MTRGLRSKLAIAGAAGAALALSASPGQAADTTIGVDVNQPHDYTGACTGGAMMLTPCTTVNVVTNPARTMQAPCDGTVVRFRLNGVVTVNTYRIRAVTDNGDGTWTPTATSSPPVSIQTAGANEFPASMPIKQGQYVGLDFTGATAAGLRGQSAPGHPGLLEHYFYTFPADGTPDTPTGQDPAIYLYNADVRCGGAEPAKTKCKKKKKKKKRSATAAKKKKKGCKKKKKKKK
jgi:hypothetical protein